jgi:hypothetical protein
MPIKAPKGEKHTEQQEEISQIFLNGKLQRKKIKMPIKLNPSAPK